MLVAVSFNSLKYLVKLLSDKNYILYFHNDPLTMSGSKSISERIFLLKTCFKIIFNSNWSKKKFLEGMKTEHINSEKLIVINQSAKKNNINLKSKKKIITFVGKLNKAKGYDIFGKAIIKILNKYKNWSSIVVGDEWSAGNLSYHLKSRPKWMDSLKNKASSIEPDEGVIYTGNPEILKKVCPGVFGEIKPVGYCMIGQK